MMKSEKKYRIHSRVMTITHEHSQHYTLVDEFTINDNKWHDKFLHNVCDETLLYDLKHIFRIHQKLL